MKTVAIALTIFPGSLLVLSVISFIFSSFAERNLPNAPGANIGLGLIILALIINIPTIIVWGLFFLKRTFAREVRK